MTDDEFRAEVLELLRDILKELKTNAANRAKALQEYGLRDGS